MLGKEQYFLYKLNCFKLSITQYNWNRPHKSIPSPISEPITPETS